ncbi:Glucan endo-1,3-beta-D-glucosidase [Handroanthus impetiginosus]|uniref:Glucan endo-1,3-beta-D-glucosidase n=1 Tax=Handroanthus impetiginosus TaxID=429701 RepID=A0A2G9GXQ0_9LAMI|nr:Glucan endo-1,3-beta-D-glucosidase [Handroanthus impetiginosus]
MGKSYVSLFLIGCLLSPIVYAYGESSKLAGEKELIYYCVAQRNANLEALQGFINYACGIADCSPIQPGGACFVPNLITNHASYALDLIYVTKGFCNKDIGVITPNNPCN